MHNHRKRGLNPHYFIAEYEAIIEEMQMLKKHPAREATEVAEALRRIKMRLSRLRQDLALYSSGRKALAPHSPDKIHT